MPDAPRLQCRLIGRSTYIPLRRAPPAPIMSSRRMVDGDEFFETASGWASTGGAAGEIGPG
jgi:hypothetical protein